MNRKATGEDLPALAQLWNRVFGDPEEFALFVLNDFCGLEGAYLHEENGSLVALLCAVPVKWREQRGAYFYGLCTQPERRGRGIMADLMETACKDLKGRGCSFVCLIPAEPSLFGYYEKHGFQRAFPLRRFVFCRGGGNAELIQERPLEPSAIQALRREYAPDTLQFSPLSWGVVCQDMSELGMRIGQSENGYCVYRNTQNGLFCSELYARSDEDASALLAALLAKEKASSATVTIGNDQPLLTGLGRAEPYGMIRFLATPFCSGRMQMRLMLDEE